MKPSPIPPPAAQWFVCTNARPAGDPLASGCGAEGPGVFSALKQSVLRGGGLGRGVWVTATGCLGHCPRSGCAAVLYPRNRHFTEVTLADVPELVRRTLEP